MREEFLHYIWQFQKYNSQQLQTTEGRKLQVLKVGQLNTHAGPDFSMAEIRIDEEHWHGHIEIHLRSSDWEQHGHQNDPNYNPVILHVVWEHNQDISLPNGGKLPVLQLKDRVPKGLLEGYTMLMTPSGKFIPCERDLGIVPNILWDKWLERLFMERLEKKSTQLLEWLERTNYHWEAVCFYSLAKVFGMKVNADSFVSIVQSVDFSIVQKCRSHPIVLEALLLGQAGILDEPQSDPNFQSLKAAYGYLKLKFRIENQGVIRPKYFRLRPNNFPTIRLSQLAVLWSSKPNFSSCIRSIQTKEQAYSLFTVDASRYWDTHYRFGIESKQKSKKLSHAFIDLILINAVLPFQLLYGKMHGTFSGDLLETLARDIPMEKNKIITQFKGIRRVEDDAWNGQALLQLHQGYCSKIKCLSCEVGNFFLKNS